MISANVTGEDRLVPNTGTEIERLRQRTRELEERLAELEEALADRGGPRPAGDGTHEELAEREALIRSFGSNLPHAMLYQVDVGPDGQRRRFTYLSESVRRLHGCSPAEAMADPSLIYGQVVEEDRPRLQRDEARAVGASLPFNIQIRMRSPDGSIRWSHFASAPRRLEDGSVRWDGIEVDITERKRAEEERTALLEQLAQAQKMESVGRLAGGVAHDFNNLLTPIMGHGELLLESFGAEDVRRRDLEGILRAAERARLLVRQLLAFSRKQALELRPLDLNQTIADFTKLLRRTIREDIHIEFLPAPVLPAVRADVVQIEQVIMNLAVNAQDAMPSGGQLTIQTAWITPESGAGDAPRDPSDSGMVELTVRDTGRGMDAATRERIFEPFFTTKSDGNGTGLGLATVYGIVAQHGGAIQVESREGEGSAFVVSLPAVGPAVEEAGTAGAAAAAASGSETILLVEDDEAVRRFAESVLKRHGYAVLVAGDGREALAILARRESPVDLLLTDVVMPGISGRELYLRAAGERPNLRVLFMSGYASEAVFPHGLMVGDAHFLQKPFTGGALVSRIRDVLGSDTRAAPAR